MGEDFQCHLSLLILPRILLLLIQILTERLTQIIHKHLAHQLSIYTNSSGVIFALWREMIQKLTNVSAKKSSLEKFNVVDSLLEAITKMLIISSIIIIIIIISRSSSSR